MASGGQVGSSNAKLCMNVQKWELHRGFGQDGMAFFCGTSERSSRKYKADRPNHPLALSKQERKAVIDELHWIVSG